MKFQSLNKISISQLFIPVVETNIVWFYKILRLLQMARGHHLQRYSSAGHIY